MKPSILFISLMLVIWGCENTTGQYRHDPNHHEKLSKLIGMGLSDVTKFPGL